MKTREEQMMDAADRYADEVCDGSCTGAQLAETINDFCAGWRTADSYPNWIAVEERLPKVGEPVWFYTPSMDEPLKGAYQENGTWYSVEYECKFINGVTHWMEIQPPRKEE